MIKTFEYHFFNAFMGFYAEKNLNFNISQKKKTSLKYEYVTKNCPLYLKKKHKKGQRLVLVSPNSTALILL